jgi:primosomal protein N' (replication factor Y)
MKVARVIVDVPIGQPLDYAFGAVDPASIPAGTPVMVPVKTTAQVGVVVGHGAESVVPPGKLRPIEAAIAPLAPLSDRWLRLTRFAADYYHHAWGEVAVPALPPMLRRAPPPRFEQRLTAMRQAWPGVATAGDAEAVLQLRSEQQAAIDAIGAAAGYARFLLFGITGSGKTAVYLGAIGAALAVDPGAQALLLVPEINLTPQLEALVRARFPGECVVSLHSGLADGERNAAWLAAHEGRAPSTERRRRP